MKTIFLDTNIFIQCRDLEQLPLAEAFGEEKHILLLIPRAVQKEIDRHKQEGHTRRAKRARRASSFFRRIILSQDTKIIIKDSDPIVEISFTPLLNSNCELPDILDMSQPDDRILAEIINYKHRYSDADVLFLTHDTNPLLTAKRCGLPYHVVPDDWLLKPAPDPRDKKIIELENRLKELQNNCPIIEAFWTDDSGNEIDRLPLDVVRYGKLEESEIDELVNEAKQRFPMETNFSKELSKSTLNLLNILQYQQRFIPPSADEVEKYQNEEYPTWIKKVIKFFATLPEIFENQTRYLSFSISISNNGNFPAENTIVEFNALGGIYLSLPAADDESIDQNENMLFPPPPKSPEGRLVGTLDRLTAMMNNMNLIQPNFDHLQSMTKRDKNAFYWKNGTPNVPEESCSFECEDFRHKIEPEIFNIGIIVPTSKNDITKGAVECSISARNLPKPAKFYINLIVTYTKGDSLSEVRKYLANVDIDLN